MAAGMEPRIEALENQVLKLQRLVRLLVLSVVGLTLAIVVPAFVEIISIVTFVALLAGLIFLARTVADGNWQRLTGPARALYNAMRAPRSA